MADNLTCLVVTKDSEKDNVQINSDKYNFQLKNNKVNLALKSPGSY